MGSEASFNISSKGNYRKSELWVRRQVSIFLRKIKQVGENVPATESAKGNYRKTELWVRRQVSIFLRLAAC